MKVVSYVCDRCKNTVKSPCAKVDLYTREIIGYNSGDDPIKQLIVTAQMELCGPCLEGLRAHLGIDGTGNK